MVEVGKEKESQSWRNGRVERELIPSWFHSFVCAKNLCFARVFFHALRRGLFGQFFICYFLYRGRVFKAIHANPSVFDFLFFSGKKSWKTK